MGGPEPLAQVAQQCRPPYFRCRLGSELSVGEEDDIVAESVKQHREKMVARNTTTREDVDK